MTVYDPVGSVAFPSSVPPMLTDAPTKGLPVISSRTVPVRTPSCEAHVLLASSRQSRTPVVITDMLRLAVRAVKSAGIMPGVVFLGFVGLGGPGP